MVVIQPVMSSLRHGLFHEPCGGLMIQLYNYKAASVLSLQLTKPMSTCSNKPRVFSYSPTVHRYEVTTPTYVTMNCVHWVHTTPQKGINEKQIEDNIKKIRQGDFESVTNPEMLSHFKKSGEAAKEVGKDGKVKEPAMGTYAMPHPIWSEDELHNVVITHKKPVTFVDKMAYLSIKIMRTCFDIFSGFSWRKRTEGIWLTRIIFLEAVAGVPGMVGAMARHLHSLRRMRRDHGWIHTLLEEAENERMHLMTALQVRQPGVIFRIAVVVFQGIFTNAFFLAYLICPRFCHRFVGYLEEEAVVTYTKCLQDIETGDIQHWKTQPAPAVAKNYWKLRPDATMRDVILAIRADEAHHRVVNHTLGSMKPDDYNPYKPGQ